MNVEIAQRDDVVLRHAAEADLPAIDVRLTCRPTLKRTRPVARFLAGLVDEARQRLA